MVMKNVTIGWAVAQALRKPLSIFPQINPMSRGIKVATRALNGMDASPVAPRATKVKKGPSLRDRIEIAPVSVALPNWDDSDMYSEPLELVMAAINTNGVRPSMPAGPHNFPTRRPTATPKRSLMPVRVTPLYSGIPT